MKKFNITLEREDEYEIEIDETYWTPERLQEWSDVFYSTDGEIEQFIEHISKSIFRNGYDEHHEGFGYFKCFKFDYDEGIWRQAKINDYSKSPIVEVEYFPGVSVKLIDYDSFPNAYIQE